MKLPPRPQISWHRGGAELAPRATLLAFAEAAAHAAELIEVDIRRTADGALVCAHDPCVAGVGEVAELVWGEVGPRVEGEGRVFGLAAFLRVLAEHDEERRSGVHLDLKEVGYEAEAVAAVLAEARRVTVTSRHDASIAAVRETYPAIPALLTIGGGARGLPAAARWQLRAAELAPFGRLERCGATGVAAHYLLATPVLRAWCTARGLELLVWTVDNDRALERWLRRGGADVVVTNRPLTALGLRDGAAPRSQGR